MTGSYEDAEQGPQMGGPRPVCSGPACSSEWEAIRALGALLRQIRACRYLAIPEAGTPPAGVGVHDLPQDGESSHFDAKQKTFHS